MKIKFFASLKDHFGDEMESDDFSTVNDLFIYLAKTKPDASDLLIKCRFAVNLAFVGNDSSLLDVSEVLVMPPSSGG
ncbi:MAG: MoaD/ThiS family protein [Opitutaceae bacterium]|nr:MoaD/ThiS family protein [Cytophagales bacterium]